MRYVKAMLLLLLIIALLAFAACGNSKAPEKNSAGMMRITELMIKHGETSETIFIIQSGDFTIAATNVTGDSATLNGSFINNDNIVEYGFYWGDTENPGIKVSSGNTSASALSFMYDLTGLSPNTTYYCRTYAGANAGPVINFTTPDTASTTTSPGDGQSSDPSGDIPTNNSTTASTAATAVEEEVETEEEEVEYTYTAYLEPEKNSLAIGDTLLVDVMLVGESDYNQFVTEIAYDTALLEYAGYANLHGVVAACATVAPNKVVLRSVSSMKMTEGAPCSPAIKMVTLQFKAKSNFAGESMNTELSFASIAVSPPSGTVFGALTAPGKPVTITVRK
jgi:uncharacterized protein YcfL